jgi:hypothetical protein
MKQILIGLWQVFVGFWAWLYMIPICLLIKWDKEPSYANGVGPTKTDSSFCIRGDLPSVFKELQTMDSRCSGYYEAPILRAYGDGSWLRRTWAAYLWLGHRNRAQGLAALRGKPAVDFIGDPLSDNPYEDKRGWVETKPRNWSFTREADGTWRKYCPFFWSKTRYWVWGWEVYKKQDGSFWAVNQITWKVK